MRGPRFQLERVVGWSLSLSMSSCLGTIRIKVPQDRKSSFNSSIVPKNESVDPRVKEDMAGLLPVGSGLVLKQTK